MLAPVLAMTRCLSVCVCLRLSVISRCSIETDERIELNCRTEASFDLSYTVLQGNSILEKGYFPLELCFKLLT